jgi:hypothetical protein
MIAQRSSSDPNAIASAIAIALRCATIGFCSDADTILIALVLRCDRHEISSYPDAKTL